MSKLKQKVIFVTGGAKSGKSSLSSVAANMKDKRHLLLLPRPLTGPGAG
jgi:polynucleotide 5'-kinase involved in rRNA processing